MVNTAQSNQRVLAVFDQFLRFMRGEPAIAPPTKPPEPSVDTVVLRPRVASQSKLPAISAPATTNSPNTGARIGPASSVVELLRDMLALLRYGYAERVQIEIHQWLSQRTEDLPTQLEIADWELKYLGLTHAMDRWMQIAEKSLGKGDYATAQRAIERARRVSPNDVRVIHFQSVLSAK